MFWGGNIVHRKPDLSGQTCSDLHTLGVCPKEQPSSYYCILVIGICPPSIKICSQNLRFNTTCSFYVDYYGIWGGMWLVWDLPIPPCPFCLFRFQSPSSCSLPPILPFSPNPVLCPFPSFLLSSSLPRLSSSKYLWLTVWVGQVKLFLVSRNKSISKKNKKQKTLFLATLTVIQRLSFELMHI